MKSGTIIVLKEIAETNNMELHINTAEGVTWTTIKDKNIKFEFKEVGMDFCTVKAFYYTEAFRDLIEKFNRVASQLTLPYHCFPHFLEYFCDYNSIRLNGHTRAEIDEIAKKQLKELKKKKKSKKQLAV